MKDVMIDLETMGDEAGSVIVSIGAVQFDIDTGQTGKQFYREIKWSTCLAAGLKVSASTICWWLEQSDEAKAKVISAEETGLDITSALIAFSWFLKHELKCEDLRIWGNSNRFDLGILAAAYLKINAELPWKFYNERDVRTIADLKPFVKENMVFEGIKHFPIDDCKHQIKYLCKTRELLLGAPLEVCQGPTKPNISFDTDLTMASPQVQWYTKIPKNNTICFPYHVGKARQSFFLPLEDPLEVNECISPTPNSQSYALLVMEKLYGGNKVRLITDDDSSYFPDLYLKNEQKFYKL